MMLVQFQGWRSRSIHILGLGFRVYADSGVRLLGGPWVALSRVTNRISMLRNSAMNRIA